MSQPPAAPATWLICSDELLRARLARGLRIDGMNVIEFEGGEPVIAALQRGAPPAIAALDAAGLASAEIVEGLCAGSPSPEIVLFGEPSDGSAIPRGAHRFRGEINVWRLSRFLRLVVARPALRSALQASYRLAHEQTPPLTGTSR